MPIYCKDGVRLLHVHIPKTGGTSITRMAIDNGWRVEQFATNHPAFNGMYRPSGSPPQTHATWHVWRHWQFDDAFAIIRNPYERMQSELAQRRVPKADAADWMRQMFADHERLVSACQEMAVSANNAAEWIQLNGGWPGAVGMHIWQQGAFVNPHVTMVKYGNERGVLRKMLGCSDRPRLRQAEPGAKYKLSQECKALVREFYAVDFKLWEAAQ